MSSMMCCTRLFKVGPKDDEHPLLVAAKKELLGTDDTTTLEQDLRTLFDRIDLDGSDNLDLPEVIIFFKSITDDLSMENIERIFKKLDEDGNKVLDFGEFKNLFHEITVAGWKKIKRMSNDEIKEEEIKYLFNLIDTDDSGFLSMKEALKAARLIKARFGITEVESWMVSADINKDGVLSYDEFKQSLDGVVDL